MFNEGAPGLRRAGPTRAAFERDVVAQPLSRLVGDERGGRMFVPTCDFGPHFWPRKKHLFYLAWGRGGDFKRYRLRFCADHTTVVEEYLSKFELSIANLTDGGARNGVVYCLSCGKPIDELGWQVFVTGYPAQDERKDYWGGLHVKHQLPDFLQDPVKESPSA